MEQCFIQSMQEKNADSYIATTKLLVCMEDKDILCNTKLRVLPHFRPLRGWQPSNLCE